MPLNDFGQPVGESVDWEPGTPLAPSVLSGRTVRLEPLETGHFEGLFAALCLDSPPSLWTYLSIGPFTDVEEFAAALGTLASNPAMVAFALVLPDGGPVGIASYLRIDHANGTAEVGHLTYGSALQRRTAATEAMYLMAAHAFDVVGVRRYEWKCDALNDASRKAATRLGFEFEGVFRQALVYKGRNRDTAWFAITDRDWPAIRAAFLGWLDPTNFDEHGWQRSPLQTRPVTTKPVRTKPVRTKPVTAEPVKTEPEQTRRSTEKETL